MKTINSKIMGSTFVGGQKYMGFLNEGDILIIEKDHNPYHDKSILLKTKGFKLGYIKKETAELVYENIVSVKVKDINQKNGMYGVNIKIEVNDE